MICRHCLHEQAKHKVTDLRCFQEGCKGCPGFAQRRLVSQTARFVPVIKFEHRVDEEGKKSLLPMRELGQKPGARGQFANGVVVEFQPNGSMKALNKPLSRRKRRRLEQQQRKAA